MTTEQIKKKIEVGDYVLASKMLNTTPENIRTRFARSKEDVIKALQAIIENREKFIKNYQKKIHKKLKEEKGTLISVK